MIGVILLTSAPFFEISKAEAAVAPAGVLVSDIPAQATGLITSIKSTITSFTTVQDFLNNSILRKLAVTMMRAIIKQMSSDIITWINSGFEGSPAFATNPGGLFLDIADETIGQFIEGSELGFLCSPFRLDIRIALAQSFQPYRRRAGCTLTGIGNNVTGFIEGNNSGGWDNWLARTTQPQNNPYTSFLMAQNEVAIRIAGRKEIKLAQLNWGNGFLSWDKCTDIPTEGDANFVGPLAPGQGDQSAGVLGSQEQGPLAPGQVRRKQACETMTPGKVIQDQLSHTLGTDLRQLELADEIDKIIGALVTQAAKQALGGVGGLLGASKPQASQGGRSFLDTYNNTNRDALLLQQGGESEISRRITASTTAFNVQAQQRESAIRAENSATVGAGSGEFIDTTERNIALNKLAFQSSIQNGYGPHLAVDGNLDAIPSGYFKNLAITNTENQPWWEVDLGKNYAINRVIISPRGDGYDPLINFHLFTSPNPFPSNFNPVLAATGSVFKSSIQNPPAPYTNTITIPVNRDARYVRIQAVDTRSIDLAEVRVFGADIAVGGGGGGTNPTDDFEQPLSISISPETTQGIAFGRDGLFSTSFRITGNKDATGLKVESNLYLISGASRSSATFSGVFSQLQARLRNSGVNTPTTVPLNSSQYVVTPSADLSRDYEFSVTYTGNALPVCAYYDRSCRYVTGGNYQLETVVKDSNNTVLGRQITEFTFNQ